LSKKESEGKIKREHIHAILTRAIPELSSTFRLKPQFGGKDENDEACKKKFKRFCNDRGLSPSDRIAPHLSYIVNFLSSVSKRWVVTSDQECKNLSHVVRYEIIDPEDENLRNIDDLMLKIK